MNREPKILALVPARGGSKRVPGKNTRLLGGKPLLLWTLESARGIRGICDILVSTDSLEISDLAKSSGALVPWFRPAELATDTSSTVEVAIHALDWYEKEFGAIDGLLILQPTSPFRKREWIEQAIALFMADSKLSVISVSPTHAHPLWTMRMKGDHCVPYFSENGLQLRSQDLPTAYVPNGAIYLCAPASLRNEKKAILDRNIPLIINSSLDSMDIDTEEDFFWAECYLERGNRV
jgi:CMP-N-acetylneuraminic acid synthetase